MKKHLLLYLIVILLGAIFNQAPAQAKSLELVWTVLVPDVQNCTADVQRQLAKRIEEATEGRIRLKIFWGGQLGKPMDFVKMISGGFMAQGGKLVMSFSQWELPLWAASGMPFFTSGYRVAPLATWELGHEWGPMIEEMERANLKPLGIVQGHESIICTKEPITSLSDLKGKNLWVTGFWQKLMGELDIVPVPLSPAEAYDGLQKGLLDGVFGLTYQAPKQNQFVGMIKYFYDLPLGGQTMVIHVINKGVWNKISPKDQKTIEDISYDVTFNGYVACQDAEFAELKTFYKSKGVNESKLPDADIAMIESIGPNLIWNDWVATAKERGVPGEEWIEKYRAKVKEVSARISQ